MQTLKCLAAVTNCQHLTTISVSPNLSAQSVCLASVIYSLLFTENLPFCLGITKDPKQLGTSVISALVAVYICKLQLQYSTEL